MQRFGFSYVFLIISIFFMLGFSSFGHNPEIILKDERIIAMEKDFRQPKLIYVASSTEIYKTIDDAANWQKIFSNRVTGKEINKIYLDPVIPDVIYVLTHDGVFVSDSQGVDWKHLFKGSSDLENNCLTILATKKAIFLGTQEGLFISNNQGKTWQKLPGQFSDSVVSAIVGNDEVVYLASDRGVFISENNGENWERVYVVYNSEIPSEDYSDYDGEVSDKILSIKSMVLAVNKLYIATKKGIFLTENKGASWQNLTTIGLSTLDIRSLEISEEGLLYAATDKGLFELKDNYWKQVHYGLAHKDLSDLMIENEKIFWIAGKGGLYRLNTEADTSKAIKVGCSQEDIENLFVGEPTIEQVQGAAIEYADANINKIRAWHKQSRFKALFPSFSVGYDKIIYGSSSGAMAIGPRDWDMGFSWDIADLIWSSDQTSIDSRSRLTVQLRQDVLDQVTNLYFERRRLKAELLLSPPTDDVDELYRNLEIQQVTANIDALTNIFFTRFTQKNKT